MCPSDKQKGSHEHNILVPALAPTTSPSWTSKGMDIYLEQQTNLPITGQWKLWVLVKGQVSNAKEKYQDARNKHRPKIRLYPNSTTLRNGSILYEHRSLPFIMKTVTKVRAIAISLLIMPGISCKLFVMNNNPKVQIYRKVSSSTNIHKHVSSPWQTSSKIN